MFAEGADIIDIGGESTRPGARPVSIQDEIDRVCPVIAAVAAELPVMLSVDTYKSEVAEAALRCGAVMVNDISGLAFDPGMARVAAHHDASIVIMHIKGTPENMQVNPVYCDLLGEINTYLGEAVRKAVLQGVSRDRIIVDPGIGFGKTFEDNYRILNNLDRIISLGLPLLIGLSRKSLIGRLYQGDADRLPATIALNMYSVLNGASVIRVHDVREHRLALDGIEMLKRVS
jgi:dihydropteroate synthase